MYRTSAQLKCKKESFLIIEKYLIPSNDALSMIAVHTNHFMVFKTVVIRRNPLNSLDLIKSIIFFSLPTKKKFKPGVSFFQA